MVAFQPHRIAAFVVRFDRIRYGTHRLCSSVTFPSSVPTTLDVALNSFGTEEPLGDEIKIKRSIDESHVLAKLSDLLPIRHSISAIQNSSIEAKPENQLEIRALHGFLAPEDKLRGVFLQKLRGKAAIEQALSKAGVELSTDVVARVLDRGSLSGESMVFFFRWATKQPTICKDAGTYHIILKALGRRKFFTFMLYVLHDMRLEGVSPTCDTVMIVMDSYARAHQVSKAIQIFGQLEEYGGKCDTESLNVLLRCLCRRSHVSAANSLLNKMKGKMPFDVMTYNLIISGWARFGRISEMEATLKAMTCDGLEPDCLTFSYILEGLGRAGQIDDAVEIFNSMKDHGCLPDTGVYNAMISNFISVGDLDESMRYYTYMLSNNCEPNIDTYMRLISALLKARKVADAMEMFDEMLARGIVPSTGAITFFIEPLCGYGPPHAALMIYKKAKKIGCKISLNAYKLLLMRLSRFGKCGMLLNVWDDMEKAGYFSNVEVYDYVINGLCNVGQLQNAILVMEESLRKGFCPSRLTCSKLRNKLLTSNKVQWAHQLFLKIKDARQNSNARRIWRARGWHF